MAKVTVGVPQGTRDFGPDVVRKRNYIFNTIRSVFELYGFEPLETPAMENLDTLMGKYGEEGDKLIFRVLDSGNPFQIDFIKGLLNYLISFRNDIVHANPNIEGFKGFEFLQTLIDHPTVIVSLANQLSTDVNLAKKYLSPLKNQTSGKALKYDLTIPFARYVAMNHKNLTFPFKRYQIQPVWRADRPQKGRYREFYQCDADVVGSNSLLNEVELANIYATVFDKLKVNAEIRINSRKILTALAELCGSANRMMDITIAIDKIDKIGLDKVKQELIEKQLNEEQVGIIEKYLLIARYSGDNDTIIAELKKLFTDNVTGIEGVNDIQFIFDNTSHLAFTSKIYVDPTLARGLNYYTGCIFEVKALNVQMGSIGGGGRYDDLTGLFGVPNIPGVGISFGVDRIYDVMEELKLFPSEVHVSTQVLFFNLGEAEGKAAFTLMQQLRDKNIRCELYHEPVKFDKQFKYAEKKNIPYVIIIGSKELQEKTCVIKDIRKGEQQAIPVNKITEFSFM